MFRGCCFCNFSCLTADFFMLGIFFVLPCVDNYIKVDLRTVSFDVPPQEVSDGLCAMLTCFTMFNTDNLINTYFLSHMKIA